VYPSEDVEVNAFARMLAVPACPNVRHGRAVEETCDYESGAISERYPHKGVDRESEFFPWKDAEAKE
jgi:hypothetical protein